MIFNSYIFTLCFLPFVVILYYILNDLQKYFLAKLMLIGSSLIFIGYGDRASLFVLMISALLTWVFGMVLLRGNHFGVSKKVILGIAVLLQIVILGYFKYTHFIVQNMNKFAHTSFSVGEILIPIGISFITFQNIAFLMDLYRGKIKEVTFWDYLFYISYFPKLVQGPITKYQDLISQINDAENRKVKMENISYGFWLFATGLARKVLVADILSKAVVWGYGSAIENITAMDALIMSFCFTFQIYFDFSGYSHMALGISKMLNLRLLDNFDAPYRSTSVTEFWKRWHISLTGFLREYLYFPLGGSKKGKFRTCLNTMIVFLISGLWHGAAWNYVFWGGLHGAAQCIDKVFRTQWEKLHAAVRWVLTFFFVNATWIFFRAESVSHACAILRKIVRMENMEVSQGLSACFELPEIGFLAGRFPTLGEFIGQYCTIGMSVFLILVLVLCLCMRDRVTTFRPSIAKCIVTIFLFSWSLVSFSTVVEFIYGSF